MSDTEVAVQVTTAVPNIIVRVKEDNTINHQGKHYEPGGEFETEGPTAIALVQGGHVEIVGSVQPKGKK